MTKFVYRDEETGEPVVSDLSSEQIEMLQGFYDLPEAEVKPMVCRACNNWNHWHETPDGTCDDPRCECEYRPEGEDRG